METNNSFKKLSKTFFVSAIAGFGVFLISFILFNYILPNFVPQGDKIKFFITGETLFGDFVETLSFPLARNPYSGEYFGITSIYPAFAIYLCAPLSLLCKEPLMQFLNKEITLAEASTIPSFRIAFFIYYFVTYALIILFAILFLKEKKKLNYQTLIPVMLFSPFLFAFMRGNNTFSIALFTIMFFYFMEKDNWMKELGYISFACATAMRFYPVLMIFYIIYKAKGKEKIFGVLKALGYTAIVLVIPFLFTEGGLSNIQYLIRNAFGFGAIDSGTDPVLPEGALSSYDIAYTWLSNSSIMTLNHYFFNILKFVIPSLPADQLINIVSKIMRFALLGFVIILPIIFNKADTKFEFSILAVAAYVLFPNVSNAYCLTLMVVPFIFFLLDYEKIKTKDKWVYIICFFVLACPASFALDCSLQNALATLVLAIKSIIVIIRENIPLLKSKTKKA